MIYLLVLLWVSPADNSLGYGETHSTYKSLKECEKALNSGIDVPAIQIRDAQGNPVNPTSACIAVHKS